MRKALFRKKICCTVQIILIYNDWISTFLLFVVLFFYHSIWNICFSLIHDSHIMGVKDAFLFCGRLWVVPHLSSLSIRRFWGKRGKMEAKKGESWRRETSSPPSPLPHQKSPLPYPLRKAWYSGYHLSSGIVEWAKRERTWKSPHARKRHRVSPFSRGLIFTRARVSLALLSLRKNGVLLVV